MNKELYRPLIFELSEEGRQGFCCLNTTMANLRSNYQQNCAAKKARHFPRSTSPQSCAIIPTAAVTISAWIRASIPWGLAR